jgi:hypothetical protein
MSTMKQEGRCLHGILAVLLVVTTAYGQEKPALPPPPTKAEAKEALGRIRDIFEKEYSKSSAEDRKALAQKLLTVALPMKDDPAARYVMLTEARDLAAKVSDFDTALAAVNAITKGFAVDPVETKVEALDAISRQVRTPPEAKKLTGEYIALTQTAIEACNFDAAISLATKAEGVARRARDAALYTQSQELRKEARSLQSEYRPVKSALLKLTADPEDPASNLVVGRFYCFARGLWELGIPYLVKCSDAKLRGLAEKDLAAPKETAEQVKVGDAWGDAAENERSKTMKDHLQGRAVFWYEKARAGLSGIAKLKVLQRVKQYREAHKPALAFIAEKSMKLYPVGYKQMIFPKMENDDPLGPFKGQPIYFNQKTGTDVVYEINSPAPLRRLYWKGAAMQRMMMEILDAGGKVIASSGPHAGGNKWAEFTLDFPPTRRFILRFRNYISTWYFIDTLKLE